MDAGEFRRVVSACRGRSGYGWMNFESRCSNQEVFVNSTDWGSRGVGGMHSEDGGRIDATRFISKGRGHGIRVNIVNRHVNHSFSTRDIGFGKTMRVDVGSVDV
jgi:hypothetical protein